MTSEFSTLNENEAKKENSWKMEKFEAGKTFL
jgi:hypothetical protein